MNQTTFQLTDAGIDTAVEQIRAYFNARKVADREVLKLGLLIEEALLRWRDQFGASQEATVETSRFASARVTVRCRAAELDPLRETEADGILSSAFLQNLLAGEETSTTWRYRNGCNELIAIARRERKRWRLPGGAITVAVLLAVAAALLTKLLPEAAADFLLFDLTAPLFSRLMSLITMVAGPLIWISVISGICALNDVATLSTIGLKAIKRFALVTVLLITFSVIVSLAFFPGISTAAGGALNVSEIIEMFLDLIPHDMVTPFAQSKTIQIILIAVAIGVALLVLDEKTPRLRELVSEVNRLVFTVMGFVSRIIPFAVFLSIYKAVSLNSRADILGVWKLVVSAYVVMVPFAAGMVAFVCLRRKLSIRAFLATISRPALVGFTTASGTVAMTQQFETAKTVMHKDEQLVDFWVPLSHAMFSPSVVPPLVTAAFFAGRYYGTPLSVPQILILYILITQLSIASPKVPGGIMATFTIMLGQLGLPADIVGLLMVANVFVVNAMTGLAMVIRSTELEEFSHAVKEKQAAEKEV